MKIRIASSIALAAGLVLGASGCGLIAPQATLESYAPSDGIDLNVGGVDLRNVLLIADESGENFNVVFSAVNNGDAPVDLSISFSGEGSQKASAEFTVPAGVTEFGHPEGDHAPVLVTLAGLVPGATASAYFQIAGADEVQYDVPALDGEFPEYREYVLPASFATLGSEDADIDAQKPGTGAASKTETSTTEAPAE